MAKKITCSDCPLCGVEVESNCPQYCSDMADFIDEIRTDAIDECIKAFRNEEDSEYAKWSFIGIIEVLEQLKEQKNGELQKIQMR